MSPDRWFSFVTASLVHLTVLAGGERILMSPPRYGVEPGYSSVEVNLVGEQQDQLLGSWEAGKLGNAPASQPSDLRIDPSSLSTESSNSVSSSVGALVAGAYSGAKPGYLRNPPPRYPDKARRLGQEGVVHLAVSVDREGRAAAIELKRSSGFALLDEAAVKAVKGWRFEPARWGALLVESKVEFPIRFRLKENI